MPEQKFTVYEGALPRVLTSKVRVNIDLMERGNYELQIVHKGKVLRRVYFSKP